MRVVRLILLPQVSVFLFVLLFSSFVDFPQLSGKENPWNGVADSLADLWPEV